MVAALERHTRLLKQWIIQPQKRGALTAKVWIPYILGECML